MEDQVGLVQSVVSKGVGEVEKIIFGQRECVISAYVALLSGGHLLLEGVPGLGKTLLAKSIAQTVDCAFGRVQFTPDLMPLDIIGSSILQENRFVFHSGPIFTDLLLADEINRAPSKTQSALLEAMQEGTVTADGVTHQLSDYFTVIATQNPIDQEGTYPLPESEIDRFMMKVVIDFPSEEDELRVMSTHHSRTSALTKDDIQPVIDRTELTNLRNLVMDVSISEDVMTYANSLVRATRQHISVMHGASPRAGISLLKACKASAAIDGRAFITPDDVKRWSLPVLRHRLVLKPGAELSGTSSDDVIRNILATMSVPT
ncbi:MAG: MoxR family ATPase [Myxococcota bacterium]|nr:MoxR family ATPase [Myxococcota bacterium]